MAPSASDIVVSLNPEHVALLEAATEALAGHEAHKRAQAVRIEAVERKLSGYVEQLNGYVEAVQADYKATNDRIGAVELGVAEWSPEDARNAAGTANSDIAALNRRMDSVYAVIDKREQSIRDQVSSELSGYARRTEARLERHEGQLREMREGLDEEITAPLGAVVQEALDRGLNNASSISGLFQQIEQIERQAMAHGLGLEGVRQRATRIDAEQRDIVACQDRQGDRIATLEQLHDESGAPIRRRVSAIEMAASNQTKLNGERLKDHANSIVDLAERIAQLEQGAEWFKSLHEEQSSNVNTAFCDAINDLNRRLVAIEGNKATPGDMAAAKLTDAEAPSKANQPGCSSACGQGFGCDGSCCAPAEEDRHFEFWGTPKQVHQMAVFARLISESIN